MRSATAHKIFENDDRFDVKSAGTDQTASTVLTRELFGMGGQHRSNGEGSPKFYPKEIQGHL